MVKSPVAYHSKQQLRRQMRMKQKQFCRDVCYLQQEAQLRSRIRQILASQLQPTDTVGAYWPLASEVDIRPLFPWLQSRSILTLPVVQEHTLVFRQYHVGDPLTKDTIGIPAPSTDALEQTPTHLLIPLLAFDTHGYRLGQGGGYYDRYLVRLQEQGHHPQKIGVAFSWQHIESVLPEEHDIPLDQVICEAVQDTQQGHS